MLPIMLSVNCLDKIFVSSIMEKKVLLCITIKYNINIYILQLSIIFFSVQ